MNMHAYADIDISSSASSAPEVPSFLGSHLFSGERQDSTHSDGLLFPDQPAENKRRFVSLLFDTINSITQSYDRDVFTTIDYNFRPVRLNPEFLLFRETDQQTEIGFPRIVRDRIKFLYTASRNEEATTPLSMESIMGFLRYCRTHNISRNPRLFVTNDGHLRAEWKENQNRKLVIDFHDQQDCFFMVFTPDVQRPGKLVCASGNSSLQSIDTHLAGFNILSVLNDPR